MKQILSEIDKKLLNERLKEAESKTGAQIVLATTGRSDSYPEIPWKAFAFGASVAGLAVFVLDLIMRLWITDTTILLMVAAILVSGSLYAILTLFFQGFARLFASGIRMEAETLQYAESVFISNELFATAGRRGVLVLISRFERRVVIIPDTGVRDRLNTDVLKNIIEKMTKPLKDREVRKALETGLDELIQAIRPPLHEGKGKEELPDKILEGETK
ncbi:MAG: hypothetical protein GYA41_09650 [Bacteroidales bacterium]|nr:hypothetical protein [Bacteroidales bacterium]